VDEDKKTCTGMSSGAMPDRDCLATDVIRQLICSLVRKALSGVCVFE